MALSLDPNAQAATILPSDSEGIVSFVKGERERKDTLGLAQEKNQLMRDKIGASNNQALGKNLEQMRKNMPETFAFYQEDISKAYGDIVSEYATAYMNGTISDPAIQKKRMADEGRLKALADIGLVHKSVYEQALKDISLPEYDTPENRKRLKYVEDPALHAQETGNMAAYEKLGPITYANQYIFNEKLLKSNIDLASYVGEKYGTEISALEEQVSRAVTNAQGGSSSTTTEQLRAGAVEKLLNDKYRFDETFARAINDKVASEGGKQDPAALIKDLSKTYAKDKKITDSKVVANPEKDNEFTMRYVKSGKLTPAAEKEIVKNYTVNYGAGKTLTSPAAMSTGEIQKTLPVGSIYDPATRKLIMPTKGNTGNMELGAGTVLVEPSGGIIWHGVAYEMIADKKIARDVFIPARLIASKEIQAKKEALELYMKQGSSGTTTNPKPNEPTVLTENELPDLNKKPK